MTPGYLLSRPSSSAHDMLSSLRTVGIPVNGRLASASQFGGVTKVNAKRRLTSALEIGSCRRLPRGSRWRLPAGSLQGMILAVIQWTRQIETPKTDNRDRLLVRTLDYLNDRHICTPIFL